MNRVIKILNVLATKKQIRVCAFLNNIFLTAIYCKLRFSLMILYGRNSYMVDTRLSVDLNISSLLYCLLRYGNIDNETVKGK